MSTTRAVLSIMSLSSCLLVSGLPVRADVGEVGPVKAKAKPVAAAPVVDPGPVVPAFIDSEATLLLVVPARYTIVQFAFDIAKLRPSTVAMVAYDDNPTNQAPRIHVWNGAIRDWMRMSLSEYRNGSFMRTPPKNIVLIGSDMPGGVLMEGSTWATAKKRVPTFSAVTLVNTLNETMSFTQDEWKTLARRYGLKLKDMNDERRRHGKWGVPGQEKTETAPMPRKVGDGAEKEAVPLPDSSMPVSEVLKPEPVSAHQPPAASVIPRVAPPPPRPLPSPPVAPIVREIPPPAPAPEDK
jgi:hypothetical protein